MRKETYNKLAEYNKQLAQVFNIDEDHIVRGHEFNVEPTLKQKLEDAVQLESDFLSKINIVPVDELEGETLKLGVTSSIAGRTDTDTGERQGANFTGLTSHKYKCVTVEYDTTLSYAQIDAWAKFKDFAQRIAKQKTKRIALDRLMVGFNGTSVAKQTDRKQNPLLQDVNIGWLEHIRNDAPAHVLSSVKLIKGSASDLAKYKTKDDEYKTLDALVYEARYTAIPDEFNNDTELVVVVGSDFMKKAFAPYKNETKPTEKIAGDIIVSQKFIGGLQVVAAPFFPRNSLLITRLDNLSIYYQSSGTRRRWVDDVKKNRYLDLLSSPEGYVVENYDAVALIENITTIDLDEKAVTE